MIQVNLNHCRSAQDLLLQAMAEWQVHVAFVSEPYSVPGRWLGDDDGVAALVARPAPGLPPLSLLERGPGYVAAAWGRLALISAYFSPTRPFSEFEDFLDSLTAVLSRMTLREVILAGDLNAKAVEWGNPLTDLRGRAVLHWAVTVGLTLSNIGSVQTCVRQWGGSVVDVTFTTPALAARISDWRVDLTESLSDHRYIRFNVREATALQPAPSSMPSPFPRWALSRLDKGLAREAAFLQDWLRPAVDDDVDTAAAQLRKSLTEVCDFSMPRSRRPDPRHAVHWWSEEIAGLRAACLAARRAYQRHRRRRNGDEGEEARLYEAYREARRVLKRAIGEAKDRARAEMLESLNSDPWGRPYKAARAQLRPIGPPLTETLQPTFLGEVVRALFPARAEDFSPPVLAPPEVEEAALPPPPITPEEFGDVERKLRAKKTAPGPDGVPARVLAISLLELGDRFRGLYDRCLAVGRFPRPWKVGQLVLLHKEGKPADSPSAYRPIVLLDEAGKMLEKIVASRLVEHLEGPGPDLSGAQYGFRAGRSTIDALARLRSITEEASGRGEGVMIVSLDIKNAFNSLPHAVIVEALRFFRVPSYLRRLVANYLSEREVVYVDGAGLVRHHPVVSGVPQGSVLGPLLWNIGYDWILRGELLPGMDIICYADDTLITARGKSFRDAARLAEVGSSLLVSRITLLGLDVSLAKTEALYFPRPRERVPSGATISVGGVVVGVGSELRYLGLTLDPRWHFGPHFRGMASRVLRAADALSRLLPNLGGPGTKCRLLYAGILRSMALYGAPIWAPALLKKGNVPLLRQAQRAIAQRVARAYRTVSFLAACALAQTPPWELEAEVLAVVYEWTAAKRAAGGPVCPTEREAARREAKEVLVRRWAEDLATASFGGRVLEALAPVLDRWLERRHGFLSFRMVQVMTGHGCFGVYLHRIQREESPGCHHCSAVEDTARIDSHSNKETLICTLFSHNEKNHGNC